MSRRESSSMMRNGERERGTWGGEVEKSQQ